MCGSIVFRHMAESNRCRLSKRRRISWGEIWWCCCNNCLFAVLFCAYRENGTVKFLTKGDNNSVDDRGLYAPGQLWLTKNDIVGRARGVLPYVGMITIYMNEYPNFKVSRIDMWHQTNLPMKLFKLLTARKRVFILFSVCYSRGFGVIRTFASRVSQITVFHPVAFLW